MAHSGDELEELYCNWIVTSEDFSHLPVLEYTFCYKDGYQELRFDPQGRPYIAGYEPLGKAPTDRAMLDLIQQFCSRKGVSLRDVAYSFGMPLAADNEELCKVALRTNAFALRVPREELCESLSRTPAWQQRRDHITVGEASTYDEHPRAQQGAHLLLDEELFLNNRSQPGEESAPAPFPERKCESFTGGGLFSAAEMLDSKWQPHHNVSSNTVSYRRRDHIAVGEASTYDEHPRAHQGAHLLLDEELFLNNRSQPGEESAPAPFPERKCESFTGGGLFSAAEMLDSKWQPHHNLSVHGLAPASDDGEGTDTLLLRSFQQAMTLGSEGLRQAFENLTLWLGFSSAGSSQAPSTNLNVSVHDQEDDGQSNASVSSEPTREIQLESSTHHEVVDQFHPSKDTCSHTYSRFIYLEEHEAAKHQLPCTPCDCKGCDMPPLMRVSAPHNFF